jgi:hypothetical protein
MELLRSRKQPFLLAFLDIPLLQLLKLASLFFNRFRDASVPIKGKPLKAGNDEPNQANSRAEFFEGNACGPQAKLSQGKYENRSNKKRREYKRNANKS